ncbi:hypothetical protein QBD00_004483 [Ochrobactrum sp. AN78]|nr:hypothetical protein [Ochrobactrum sp. AN78]
MKAHYFKVSKGRKVSTAGFALMAGVTFSGIIFAQLIKKGRAQLCEALSGPDRKQSCLQSSRMQRSRAVFNGPP